MDKLSVILKCECNNKTYSNEKALKAHKKTKSHIQWENSQELKNIKIELTKKDNEINLLKVSLQTLNEINSQLIDQISKLKLTLVDTPV